MLRIGRRESQRQFGFFFWLATAIALVTLGSTDVHAEGYDPVSESYTVSPFATVDSLELRADSAHAGT